MFSYKSPQVNCDMQELTNSISSAFLESYELMSVMPSRYNLLEEADGTTFLTGNLTNRLNSVISNAANVYKGTNAELCKYITAKHKYLSALVTKNNDKLTSISQQEMLNIRYPRISYAIPNGVPGISNSEALALVNSVFVRGDITSIKLSLLRDNLKNDLANVAAAIVRSKAAIQMTDIDRLYESLFKTVISDVEAPISNITISKLIDSINAYPNDINKLNIAASNVEKLFNSYKNIVSAMFMYNYSQEDNKVSVRLGNRVVQTISLYELGFHNSYRTAVLNHIATILNLYISLYESEIGLIKEKIAYEETLLLKLLQNIK